MISLSIAPENLGEELRKIRKAKRITQEIAAKKIGISVPTLFKIETSKTPICDRDLSKMQKVYGVEISFTISMNNKLHDRYKATQ